MHYRSLGRKTSARPLKRMAELRRQIDTASQPPITTCGQCQLEDICRTKRCCVNYKMWISQMARQTVVGKSIIDDWYNISIGSKAPCEAAYSAAGSGPGCGAGAGVAPSTPPTMARAGVSPTTNAGKRK